jgi:hypothetical protein
MTDIIQAVAGLLPHQQTTTLTADGQCEYQTET